MSFPNRPANFNPLICIFPWSCYCIAPNARYNPFFHILDSTIIWELWVMQRHSAPVSPDPGGLQRFMFAVNALFTFSAKTLASVENFPKLLCSWPDGRSSNFWGTETRRPLCPWYKTFFSSLNMASFSLRTSTESAVCYISPSKEIQSQWILQTQYQ